MIGLLSRDSKCSTLVATGELSADELLHACADLLADSPSHLVLWDLTAATLARIDTASLWQLAREMVQRDKERRADGMTAIVCGRAVDFGLVRMLMTYLSIEGYASRLAVFMDRARAQAWLDGGIEA